MLSGAGVIVKHLPTDTYLVVRGTTSHKWSFPKGSAEVGETFWQTAERELYEETNLQLSLKDKKHMVIFGYYAKRSYFYVELHDEELPLVSTRDCVEIERVSWLSRQSLLAKLDMGTARQRMNFDLHAFLTHCVPHKWMPCHARMKVLL